MKAGIVAVAVTGLTAAGVQAGDLSGPELKQFLSGRTIHLSAPFGVLPIRFHAGGTMVARSKLMAVYAGVSEDRGRWYVRGNKVCQRWKIWKKGKEQCFTLSRNGRVVRWRSSDGMSGTAIASN